MSDIHQSNHAAMATHFQVRINCDERMYAAQAAQAAFDLVDSIEARLSRFRSNSDITRIGDLAPGEKMHLSEPAFACLQIAKRMELATFGAFSATAAALQTRHAQILQPDARTGLDAFGDLDRFQPVKRQQVDLGSQRGLREVDGNQTE